MNEQIQVGWSTISITPDRPFFVAGQLYYRVSTYIHSPLTATAMALSAGDEQAVFLSCDMPCMLEAVCAKVRAAVDGYAGLDARKITFSATHTHNSSYFADGDRREGMAGLVGLDSLPELDIPDNILEGKELTDFFVEKAATVIKDAWDARVPGAVSAAADYAAVGFNRRPQFELEDGTVESKMYGTCSQKNFLRFEGTADHTIDMLYTWDLDRNLTGVLVDVPAPSQVMELHSFVSADYWHFTRNELRSRLGNIFVLPVCGAAGDQNPLDLVRISKDNVKELAAWNAQAGEVFRNFDMALECQDIAARIADAVERGYGKAQNKLETRPVFRHQVVTLTLPIRQVEKADFEEADRQVKAIAAEFSPAHRMQGKDLVRMFEPLGIVNRYKRQNENPDYTFQCNVLRIGPVAFATNPFELFVEYSLRIRARCRARQAFIFQLTNDSGGYLPTDAAIAGGSYSSKPASTVIGPRGGDAYVEEMLKAMDAMWE